MNMERLPVERHGHRYERMQPEPAPEGDSSASSSSSLSAPARRPEVLAASASFRLSEATRVFEELPRATIFSVSRPDAGDITPYTIEINYKQDTHGSCCRRWVLENQPEMQEVGSWAVLCSSMRGRRGLLLCS